MILLTIYNGVFNAKSIDNSYYEPVSTLTIPENIEDLNTKFIITKDYKCTDESIVITSNTSQT